MRTARHISILLLVLAAFPPAFAERLPAVDEIFQREIGPDEPGCAVGVRRGGEWLHRAGYGLANLEYGAPMTTSSVVRIASLSKQFTAMAALLLVEQGRLSLDDPVHKYVPEIPPREPPVLVRHLLEHTSGYREYLDLMALRGYREVDDFTSEDVLATLGRQQEHNFAAGEWHLISDTGYMLLGRIVDRVAGKSLRAFAQEAIFGPLGMHESHFHDDSTEVVRNRATGYGLGANGAWHMSFVPQNIVGDGGVFTTVNDLGHWMDNFKQPRVGGPETHRLMRNPRVEVQGIEIRHGYGWMARDRRGLQEISHTGRYADFNTYLGNFPEWDLWVAVLCNRRKAEPWGMALEVALGVLGEKAIVLEPGNPEKLAPFVGYYREHLIGWTMDVTEKGGTLAALFKATGQRKAFLPAADGTFMTADGSDRLEPLRRNGREVLVHRWYNTQPFLFERAELPPEIELEPFAGDYHCPEVPVTAHLAVDDGRLVWKDAPPSKEAVVFEPSGPDLFGSLDHMALAFQRDGGRVHALRLSRSRALNIACERVDGDAP